MSESEEKAKRISTFLRKLAGKIEENPHIFDDIEIKDIPVLVASKRTKKDSQVDISKVLSEEGPAALRQKLDQLDVKELKIIIRNNGFDPAKLAAKWKDKQRLINLIIERISARKEKGQAFINY
ncbi:MAG: hypothetical protein ABSG33_06525 [Candidatus Bathyarchaeia archaeon]|jgi:hypothetical protein